MHTAFNRSSSFKALSNWLIKLILFQYIRDIVLLVQMKAKLAFGHANCLCLWVGKNSKFLANFLKYHSLNA